MGSETFHRSGPHFRMDPVERWAFAASVEIAEAAPLLAALSPCLEIEHFAGQIAMVSLAAMDLA